MCAQASAFIRQDICTLIHQVINMNIAYLFMFSLFDFSFVTFDAGSLQTQKHTITHTSSNLDQEQIYVEDMTVGRLPNDAQKPLKNLFNSRKTFGTIYTYEWTVVVVVLVVVVVAALALSSTDWYFHSPTNFDLYFFPFYFPFALPLVLLVVVDVVRKLLIIW